MPRSTLFRFAIANQQALSECWSLFLSGDDVYLTGSAYKKTLKISLHKSGVCQIALLEEFFQEHVQGKQGAPEFRSILRWKRLPTPSKGGQVAASILFASYATWEEKEKIAASKPFTKIQPPKDMECCLVHIVYSHEDPKLTAHSQGWEADLLFSTKMRNGEFVCLMTEYRPLERDFFDFVPVASPYMSLGIPEDELGDARGISVFDCAQLFEGHGCIRSLHNMRLVAVDVRPFWQRFWDSVVGPFGRKSRQCLERARSALWHVVSCLS